MPFVEPNVFDRSSLSIGKDHRLANEFGLSLFERAEDGRGTKHYWGHDCIRMDARIEWGLFALERAKVVTGGQAGPVRLLDGQDIYGSLAPAVPR